MARAAPLGRLTWRPAVVSEATPETPAARTLTLAIDGWPGHVAGQHVDLRLTAEDGYTTWRSYSIASAPERGQMQITVERVEGGEVSPYLVDIAEPGDRMEVRGPLGGYFTWRPADPQPVLLVAGGSGIVPLMSMLRSRAVARSGTRFRLVYSVREPERIIYRSELDRVSSAGDGVDVTYAYTRRAPSGSARLPGRVDASLLASGGLPVETAPVCYVCGPTGFVELVARLLVDQGHPSRNVKTERFGPTGRL